MSRRVYALMVAFILVSSACNLTSLEKYAPTNDQLSITESSTTSETTSSTGESNADDSSLYEDDFTYSRSGWPTNGNEGDVMGYSSDNYRIYITSTNTDLIANPGQSLPADVSISVDEIKYGPEINAFGVVCRLQDLKNFYFFELGSTGTAVIGKFNENKKTYLSASEMQKVEGINSGISTNHILAVCKGDQLSLYANDHLVAQSKDSTFASGGDVGVIASSFEKGDVEILFSNFKVTKP